jgi:hypothetical protein
MPATVKSYRWACADEFNACQQAHQLRVAGIPVGVAGSTVIIPADAEMLTEALPRIESEVTQITMRNIIYMVSRGAEAPIPSRRDRAAAASYAAFRYQSPYMRQVVSGKSNALATVFNALKKLYK